MHYKLSCKVLSVKSVIIHLMFIQTVKFKFYCFSWIFLVFFFLNYIYRAFLQFPTLCTLYIKWELVIFLQFQSFVNFLLKFFRCISSTATCLAYKMIGSKKNPTLCTSIYNIVYKCAKNFDHSWGEDTLIWKVLRPFWLLYIWTSYGSPKVFFSNRIF